MPSITAAMRRHPLVAFFVLAYALSWWPALITEGLNPFGPLMAAVVVSAVVGGRPELRNWWRRVRRTGGGIGWYALAVVLPFGYFGPLFSGPGAVLETRLLVAVQCAVSLAIALLSGRLRRS